MQLKLLFILCCFFGSLSAGLLPDYDTNCNSLKAEKCRIETLINSKEFFEKKVPRILHRIWFGDQSRLTNENRKAWESYTSQFMYEYHLWTEKDADTFKTFMEPRNYNLFRMMLDQENWKAASDILRLELIKNIGGIYIDCDFDPPSYQEKYVDFFDILNCRGLTLMTEHFGRDVGSLTALFAANGFWMSPPNHPIINSCVEQVYENALNWNREKGNFCAAYATGPFFLNRVINGPFNIVPTMYFKQYNMYR